MTSARPLTGRCRRAISPWTALVGLAGAGALLGALALPRGGDALSRPWSSNGRWESSSARAAAALAAETGEIEPLGLGMAFGVFSDGEGDRPHRRLKELRDLGVGHVLLIVQEAMQDVESTSIGPRDWLTPSPERLESVVRTARELGFRITLMPTLYIEDTGDGQWRGAIRPTDWDAWWRSYQRFIVRHARLAARHDVEVFCVGSELCSTEDQRERWAQLVLRVRETTPSLLTYSFNWDHHRESRIADLLDLVGMNAYHDLSEAARPSLPELLDAWRVLRSEIEAWRRSVGRPLLFTEVGFRSVEHPALEPWDYLAERPYDGRGQARCYEAFLRTWMDRPGVAGACFYAWRGDGGPGDTGYTPRGKPAEAVLARWLSGTQGTATATGDDDHDDAPAFSD